jgi:hypothetical protein
VLLLATISWKRRMYSGSFSGATAASSTKVAAFNGPRTLVISPWPASRMRQMSRCTAGSVVVSV